MINVRQVRGLLTLQDAGRPKLEHLGIPAGGFADAPSARIANRLVGNLDAAPLLEVALTAPSLHFEQACWIAITGAEASWSLDGRPLPRWERSFVPAGATVQGGALTEGRYAYLAVGGRWEVTDYRWAGSVGPLAGMVDLGTARSAVLNRGDTISIVPATHPSRRVYATPTVVFASAPRDAVCTLDLYEAPETNALRKTYGLLSKFAASVWRVDASTNRVGIRLSGEPLSMPDVLPTTPSNPVRPGTVQLLPSGQLIVTHVDGGTMGGYLRIGCVDADGLAVLAQAEVGRGVRFSLW